MSTKLYRRFNHFRPFLIDLDTDVCDFMGNKSKRQLLADGIFPKVMPYTNLNHSCPYEGEVWLRNFEVDLRFINLFQVPTGYYRLDVRVYNKRMNETIVTLSMFVFISG